jgi:multidrug efflux pump subunit AcrA (membrane-fusion protein)
VARPFRPRAAAALDDPGAILVPAIAPQLSAKGSYVYVVKPDSTAEMRPVKIGSGREIRSSSRRESRLARKSS